MMDKPDNFRKRQRSAISAHRRLDKTPSARERLALLLTPQANIQKKQLPGLIAECLKRISEDERICCVSKIDPILRCDTAIAPLMPPAIHILDLCTFWKNGVRCINSVAPRIADTVEKTESSKRENLLRIVPEDLLRHPEIIRILPLERQITLLTSDPDKSNDQIAENLSKIFGKRCQATINSEIDKLPPVFRFHPSISSIRSSVHAFRDLLESGFLETIPDCERLGFIAPAFSRLSEEERKEHLYRIPAALLQSSPITTLLPLPALCDLIDGRDEPCSEELINNFQNRLKSADQKSETEVITIAWNHLLEDRYPVYDSLPFAMKAVILNRAAKESVDLNWSHLLDNALAPPLRAVTILSREAACGTGNQASFQEAHDLLENHVIYIASQDLDAPIDLRPLLPACPVGIGILHCEARHWDPDKSTRPGVQEISNKQNYCPRLRKQCESAHHTPNRLRPSPNWTMLELLDKADIHPSLPKMRNPGSYVTKLAGWINRINELRTILRCRHCQASFVSDWEFAKFMAKFRVTVFNCPTSDPRHDHGVYISQCWTCKTLIDSRESTIEIEGYKLCLICGSGPEKSDSFTQGNICPKCGERGMVTNLKYSRICTCLKCSHEVKIPPSKDLTGPASNRN